MANSNSSIINDESAANVPSMRHADTPEGYLVVPTDQDINIDALSCALGRARSVCLMLGKNFDGTGETLNHHILSDACWALEGLIIQPQTLIKET